MNVFETGKLTNIRVLSQYSGEEHFFFRSLSYTYEMFSRLSFISLAKLFYQGKYLSSHVTNYGPENGIIE